MNLALHRSREHAVLEGEARPPARLARAEAGYGLGQGEAALRPGSRRLARERSHVVFYRSALRVGVKRAVAQTLFAARSRSQLRSSGVVAGSLSLLLAALSRGF